MSNASLKEQLQAVASQLSDVPEKEKSAKKVPHPAIRSNKPTKPIRANKPKPKWLDFAQYGVELLKAYFPNCFKAMNEVKPLKKGIKQDLVLRLSTMDNIVTDDKACMVKSLAYYVNTMAYHKSMVAGTVRIDLDGQPQGIVTAEEANYSIERNQAKQLAKQAAVSKQEGQKLEPEMS